MSVLGEMKRRNVFRVGMAYTVAAWVLVQVMDIILQNFAAPGWVMKLLVFFCFAGFPFAMSSIISRISGIVRGIVVKPSRSVRIQRSSFLNCGQRRVRRSSCRCLRILFLKRTCLY